MLQRYYNNRVSDVHSKDIRSYNMSRIRSENTQPEDIVRKYLFAKGFRYRKNDKRYPGKPDIALPKYKTVIFVNGCFWHMHEGCPDFVMPKSNTEFWQQKLKRNRERDTEIYKQYRETGWNVLVIWECELKKEIRIHNLEKLVKDML